MTTEVVRISVEGISGPLNPAINVWHIDPDVGSTNLLEKITQILAFTTSCTADAGTSAAITEIAIGTLGGPLTTIPWPTTYVTAWNAAVTNAVYAVRATGLGVAYGVGGASAPIGTSLLITEQTSVGGRHNGRKYMPWVRASSIATTGTVDGAIVAEVNDLYRYCIMGIDPATQLTIPGGFDAVGAVAGVGNSYVLNGFCSVRPARLRSRMR